MSDPPPVLAYTQLHGSVLDAPAMQCGKYLVTPFQATLPDRCVLCNAPAALPLIQLRLRATDSFRFKWFAKHAHLLAGLCPYHKRMRAIFRLIALALMVVVLATILNGLAFGPASPPPALFGLLLITGAGSFLLSLAFVVIADRGPRVVFVRPDHLYFAGVCRDFLDSLPHYDDRPGDHPVPLSTQIPNHHRV